MQQQLKELIQTQLDSLFVKIENLVQKSAEPYSTSVEVLPQNVQQKLDQQIQELWHEIKDGIDYLSQPLTNSERFKMTQFAESEFKIRRKQYHQHAYARLYKIKLVPKTKRVVLTRKIESTESRLRHGQLHFKVLDQFKQYWQHSMEYLDDPTQIWGNLCLSFIYVSGCAHEQHLLAIQKQLQDAIEHNIELNCFRLYRSDYKKIINPLILHYRVENLQYGNDIEQKSLYQWKHVFLNPYVQLFLQRLKWLKDNQQEYRLQGSILDCILESLETMERKDGLSQLYHEIKRRGFRAFDDVQMVLEFNPKLSLDIFLSNVLQQEIKTAALRAYEQCLVWSDVRHLNVEQKQIQPIKFEQEQLQYEVTTAHRQLQTIPYELMLFNKKQNRSKKAKKVENIVHQKKKEERTLQYWREIQQKLETQKQFANMEEGFLIEAQLRLIHWLFHLNAKGLELSTLEKYLSVFGKDFVFEIWLNKLDLTQQSAEDYENLYRQLLEYSSERDEQARQRNQTKEKNTGKMPQTAQYRFGRLKDFHQFCENRYAAPEVLILQQSSFKHMQICSTRLVSPPLFDRLLEELEHLSQEQGSKDWAGHLSCLKLMYLLSYRVGLRLNEVRCLRIQDIICPEILHQHHKNKVFNSLTLSIQDNPYRRLKTQSANRQLPLKIILSEQEFLVVQQYLQRRYDQYVANRKDDLFFSVNQAVLTDQCISQITVELFNRIFGQQHGFSFHTLRHSAANHLAITWLGSKEMVKTYTDYSWKDAKKMRELLFGTKAFAYEDIIRHKWQVLAAWMGHSSIEQTASNYLHVLDLLAVDRIYNAPCMIRNKVIEKCFGSENLKTENIDLNHYIQQQKCFDFYHQQTTQHFDSNRPTGQFNIKIDELTPYQRLINFMEGRLRNDEKAQEWMQRCLLMTSKWMNPKSFKLSTYNLESQVLDDDCFEILYRKANKLGGSELNAVINFNLQKERDKKGKSTIKALETILQYGKLRKNFLHFQCRDKDDEQQIKKFITGIKPILGNNVHLEINNYPVKVDEPERVAIFSFQRANPYKKNITAVVLFNLMLKIMQCDELWGKCPQPWQESPT